MDQLQPELAAYWAERILGPYSVHSLPCNHWESISQGQSMAWMHTAPLHCVPFWLNLPVPSPRCLCPFLASAQCPVYHPLARNAVLPISPLILCCLFPLAPLWWGKLATAAEPSCTGSQLKAGFLSSCLLLFLSHPLPRQPQVQPYSP